MRRIWCVTLTFRLGRPCRHRDSWRLRYFYWLGPSTIRRGSGCGEDGHGRADGGAQCFRTVLFRLPILTTENTKNPWSSTEKSNIALRAKRLNLPDAANETTKSPSPEPPWILRVLRGENAEANAPRTCPDQQRNAARLLYQRPKFLTRLHRPTYSYDG